MTSDLIDKLKVIVADALEIEPSQVTNDMCSDNYPEWDSVRHVSIVMMIEEQCDIMFDEDDLTSMTNFGALTDIVAKKIAAA